MSRRRPFSRDVGSWAQLTDGDAPPVGSPSWPTSSLNRGTAGRPVLVHGPTERNGNLMALIACPSCSSEDINGTPQADSRLLIHCNACGTEWLRGEAPPRPRRPPRPPDRPRAAAIPPAPGSTASGHAESPTAAAVRPDVRERVMMLQSEWLLDHRPQPDPEIAEY